MPSPWVRTDVLLTSRVEPGLPAEVEISATVATVRSDDPREHSKALADALRALADEIEALANQ